jgi:adenine-specific DNA-methyltransferase
MATPSTEHYLPLPVDTLHYDAEFKWSMLEAVTAATPLDDALDGVAIQSDNWQALNVLQQKYDRKIQALYADPPYNTDAGPIDYKNGYRKGSWAALIYDRFVLSRNLLQLDGIACATIDDYQQRELHTIMEMIFGVDNRVGTVAIRANPRGRPTKKGLAVAHEYAIFFRNDPSSVLDKVERTAKQQERYKESDEQGVFEWMNFRRQGSNSDRSARWRLYYPIFLTETSLRIPKITWNEAHKEWELHEKPKHGEVVVYPIDEDGNQKTWRWMHDEVTANPDEFQVKDDRSDRRWVYFKYRPNQKGVQATTVWSDARHSATEYGTAIVKKLFGKSAFSYPKSFLAVQDCLKVAGLRDVEGWCIDIFAGSGTTAHAVMVMNADDDGKRKFILVETNKYFDSVTLNRVKKVGASLDWKDGSAEAINGSGVFVRVQSLEQYDDTLENLDTEINQGDSGELAFDDLAFSLRYRLNKTTRTLYCGTERFASPFGYQLKRAVGGGEAQSCEVDLVESLIYLLGMDVSRMFREALGVVILGSNRRGQSVAVFFRECAATDSEQWVKAKLALHPADRVYTNNPAGLGFEGCDRLEAIEAVFATQFGRS